MQPKQTQPSHCKKKRFQKGLLCNFKCQKKKIRKPKNKQCIVKQENYKFIQYLMRSRKRFEMKQNEHQQEPQPSTNENEYFGDRNDNEIQMLASHLINNTMSKEQKKQQIDKLVKQFVDLASANISAAHQDGMFYTHTNHIQISYKLYLYLCIYMYMDIKRE